jgi:hypothetical protein
MDLVRISAVMGHPETSTSSSRPLPEPALHDPDLDPGPLEDGHVLPSILRDFRPIKEKLGHLAKQKQKEKEKEWRKMSRCSI